MIISKSLIDNFLKRENADPTPVSTGSRLTVNLYSRLDPEAVWGPHIQSRYKQLYFASQALELPVDITIQDGREDRTLDNFDRYDWNHFLFPSDCIEEIRSRSNFSIGPNIPLAPIFGPARPHFERSVLAGRWIVADSEWNKSALLECFPELNPDRIVVIPVYVGNQFRTVRMKPRDDFTVGCVGYPDDKSAIKNLDAILTLARHHPEWRFELVVNRDEAPAEYFALPNLTVYLNVDNAGIPEIMKFWSCYLGIAKRERGPATIQEANTMGCPTVCADHTGYACFRPLIPLQLPPFVDLDDSHLRLIEDTLAHVAANRDAILARAEHARETFWQNHTSEKTTRQWKRFFLTAASNPRD